MSPEDGAKYGADGADVQQGRRAQPAVLWSPAYEVDLGPHVFITAKYRLARERLLSEGTLGKEHFVAPQPAVESDLAAVHTEAYLGQIAEDDFSYSDRVRLEVPFTPHLREASVLGCGGTIETCRRALEDGVAIHLGGGLHHAFAGHGEGFCLLNDVAVGARATIRHGLAARVAVVDLDLHQGNGTAAIFADDESVFTCSLHQENNYPFEKPPSDLDVGLRDGIEDEEYLETLDRALDRVLGDFAPELVLYLAGADPYEEDQLGGLRLTREGLRRRDRRVLERGRRAGAAVATVLAGGYAVRLEDTVAIHVATAEEVARIAGVSG